jgi:outer membrane protein OmpA-like peptidoglycan-associated protein
MPGFYIYSCDEEEYGLLEFRDENGEKMEVEGYKYQLQYNISKGRKNPSYIQIFRNFETAVRSIGGKLLYKNASYKGYFKIEKGDKVFWVYHYPDNGEFYILKIVEEEQMKQEIVADAESLARDIAMTGHATVFGIYFDFDKDIVKPESERALVQVAKLMKDNPGLKLYVVGHTDSKGTFDYNMDLSRRRAKAVAGTLTRTYGISADRLQGHGVGPLSPVLSNKNENGRAKNRRVELVEQ